MLLEFHSGLCCLSCPPSASASYNSPELLQRRNPPSQRSNTPGSISRCLRSSSPTPTVKSAGASSPANPITLRLTWLRQRGCTLVASLFTLHVIYIVHWALVVTGNTIILSYYMTSSEVPCNLAICDGLYWTPSLIISACLSCAFVDGPGSWGSMAVAWVQSNRSSTNTFF